jgi:peptidoglycan hydrolase-like protein with peptidoglycan-binding domain
MLKLGKYGLVLMLALLLVGGAYSSRAEAQTGTTSVAQIQALLAQLKTLQAQIEALQKQQVDLMKQVGETIALTRELRLGMTSDEVKALQAALAADPSIYPEGVVSGFFGPLTEKAVRKFQEKNGLEQVGFVGPRTRGLLNLLLRNNSVTLEGDENDDDNDGDRKERVVCVPPGHLIAPGWLRKNREGNNPVRPCKSVLPRGIEKKLDGRGTSTSTTTQDTLPPVISNIDVDQESSTSVEISWRTNETATSKVWYGTVSPLDVNASTTSSVSSDSFTRSHDLDLVGLNASSTYYFVVSSTDEHGYTATSSQRSFDLDDDDEEDDD